MTAHLGEGDLTGGPAESFFVVLIGIGCVGIFTIGLVLGASFQAEVDAADQREALASAKAECQQSRQDHQNR